MEQPDWEGMRPSPRTVADMGDAEKQNRAEFKMYDHKQILLPLICP